MRRHQPSVPAWFTAATLAAALLILAPPLAAQTRIELLGRIVDAATNRPVADALVSAGESEPARSGVDGRFRLHLTTAGELEVRVSREGYGEARVRGWSVGEETIRLTPHPLPLDELVVTASRRTQALKDVPVATEVVGRTEILQTGASDLSAVLSERTGASVEGGHPVGTGVMLQGLGSERVLILVDGQPMIGRLSGRVDLTRVPLANVERVEIVKGPQSTLYGSDAMGGVVNVITRDIGNGSWGGGMGVTGGSRGRLELHADVRGGGGPLDFVAEAGRRTIDLVPGLQQESGTYASRLDAAARVRWQTSADREVTASATVLDERQRWSTGQLFNFADNRQLSGRLAGAWRAGAHHFAPTLYATEFRHLARRGTAAEPLAGSGELEVQRLVEAEMLYSVTRDAVVLDAGIEARRELIRSDRVLGGRRSHHSAEPFVQLTVGGGVWSLVPGMRMSWSDRWGAHWTPRVAGLFRPIESLAIRAAVGSGYRAPDFKELYMEFLNVGPGFGYVVRGNPDVRPESSRSVSAGVEWAGERLYLRAQAFYNRFEDFIETRETGDSSGVLIFVYENVENGTTRGLELEAGVTWGGTRAEIGWSLLAAERAGTGEPLLGRPRRSGRFLLSHALPFGTRVSATAVHTGSTPTRFEGGTTVVREPFTRVDFRVAQALPRDLELAVGIDNLADVVPVDWPGYSGRQLHLGMTWRFGHNDLVDFPRED